MDILPLTDQDVVSASEMIRSSVEQFVQRDFTTEGMRSFQRRSLYDGMSSNLTGAYHYWKMEYQGQIVGVIAIKGSSHLYHLFVKVDFHSQGIARRLWNHAVSALDLKCVTVFSSSYAREVYAQMGFVPNGKGLQENGMVCFPMIWEKKQMT